MSISQLGEAPFSCDCEREDKRTVIRNPSTLDCLESLQFISGFLDALPLGNEMPPGTSDNGQRLEKIQKTKVWLRTSRPSQASPRFRTKDVVLLLDAFASTPLQIESDRNDVVLPYLFALLECMTSDESPEKKAEHWLCGRIHRLLRNRWTIIENTYGIGWTEL
ncbi:hypothetical protein BJ742DRAFT_743845 [Cladochytrium replicatum]|nr:hypothetical protein BJ742DRAFT_743845 [Cladochytrium replicatum]